MDIKSLDYFVQIADEKSISKVANKLFISQPALSLQIKKLEETFGHKLLTRTNRGVHLTEAGQILDVHARNILKLYNQAFDEINKLFGSHQVIRIDSNITLATYALPCMIYFAQAQPNFQDYYLDLTFSTVNDVENNIVNGISDIGYVHKKNPSYSEIRYVKIGTEKLSLVCVKDYEVNDHLTMEEFKKQPLVLLKDKFKERKPLEESLGPDFDDLNVVLSLDSTESVKTALFRGFGLSLLPHSSVKKELNANLLKEITIEGFSEEYTIYLCYLKENEQNPRLKPLLNFLKERKIMDFC
ncbi:MAG: LysR family transcriptional regulator [Anaerovoracaceae bacterium]|jgi:DNA-binding transcriptional LysR family regulator